MCREKVPVRYKRMLRVFLLFGHFTILTPRETLSFVNEESFQIISRIKRQSENHCVLPNHPADGEMKIVGEKADPYFPGNKVPLNTIIDLSCANGTVTETLGLSRAICNQGVWQPLISQMRCVRRCPPVQTESENSFVTCTHKNSQINCNNAIEGTIIQLTCQPFYRHVGRFIITCRNGTWDSEISPCQPECGKMRVTTTARESRYPWVAGIHELMKGDVWFHGGATIISRHTLLSAAHLFTNINDDRLDKNNYIVTAGKYYRDFEDQRDRNRQYSKIKRIYIPENYRRSSANNLDDFAILTLENPFVLTEYVQPVCIDWTNQFESSDLREGNKGVIAGWFYPDNDKITDELLELDVPYIPRDKCSILQALKEALEEARKEEYYRNDKLCAGYDDYSKFCVRSSFLRIFNFVSKPAGDGGRGLFFQNLDSRFYIRGILNSWIINNWYCGSYYSALYTNVSTYLPEIMKETGRTL